VLTTIVGLIFPDPDQDRGRRSITRAEPCVSSAVVFTLLMIVGSVRLIGTDRGEFSTAVPAA
jgi:hypothetical protein